MVLTLSPPLPNLHNPLSSKPKSRIRRPRNGSTFRGMSATSSSGMEMEPEVGLLDRPKWAGETPLSRFVGALISFKPFYSLMKLGARQVLISTAEKANVPWREMTREILESSVYEEFESIRDPSLVYPDYYLNPFHAYDEGNLSWLAAAEAEAATLSIGKRALPSVSIDEANRVLRGNWLKAVDQHHQQFGNTKIYDLIDIGCSVGVSTRYLADKYPLANITGLDLSPYFLAVAQYKAKQRATRSNPIRWMHANGESTGLPAKSFDLVSLAYVLHECPAQATRGLLKEAFRLLRPGGTIALTDNSPKSKVLQELSPVLFTLMKSTEPFLDEYYLLDLENTMREIGFVNVVTGLTDPRHRTVTGTVPHSSSGKRASYQEAAIELGKELVERNIDLVYGGGSIGLMGLVSDAVRAGGRHVLGVIPKSLMPKEITGGTVGDVRVVSNMHERNAEMAHAADAFIALPGGYGILEELFEVITWAQLGIHNKPVGLLNVDGYYDSLLSFIDSAMDEEFISSKARHILISAPSPKKLLRKLEEYVPERDELVTQLNWDVSDVGGSDSEPRH